MRPVLLFLPVPMLGLQSLLVLAGEDGRSGIALDHCRDDFRVTPYADGESSGNLQERVHVYKHCGCGRVSDVQQSFWTQFRLLSHLPPL